jgi:hypothetical protein
MSVAATLQAHRGWTVEAFKVFWAKPDASQLSHVRAILTDDIVGYWPRPIGVVRGPEAYLRIIENVLKAGPDFSLSVPEHASSGDSHFVRWVAKGTGPEGPYEFTGCDRLRTRNGLVCENYVFCDDPYFARVAALGH